MNKNSRKKKYLDIASTLTLMVTVILFMIAAFETGLTHDLLLEAGVFLVSAKLVIASYQQKITADAMSVKLDRLAEKLGV